MRIVDPSQVVRPEECHNTKDKAAFRNYDVGTESLVRKTYNEMHKRQTYDFVTKQKEKWTKLNKMDMTIFEALEMLNSLVDESDPDLDLPNIIHAYQTAEGIRKVHPDKDWFHLVGLIHDMGKVLALWDEPQWAVVGDTFPVGCAFSSECVFSEAFQDNPDSRDPRYNTKYGVYQPYCGLKDVHMSWGHDEYLYQVVVGNNTTLPEEALYMIRFHSFYPWHSAGAYEHLLDEDDRNMLQWVKEFNKFDLYTKCPDMPDMDELKLYYQSLVNKYLPGKLRW
ncbi:inositol oxygenase-like [Corticium candelabrum]|uniref:inositol oxygenase-like n=1 Tax=Corticium candelabrum TaxID=121492 RepID=UPI002E26A6BD|nr:inositol oxygenase-like [Corticium candelabrum]